MHDSAIGIHMKLHRFNTNFYHVSDHSVQCAIGTKNSEMTVALSNIGEILQ